MPAPTVLDTIPLCDLAAQYRAIQPEVDAAIQRSIARGDFVLGGAVTEFEEAFARYCGVDFGVGVGSGTDALFLALRGLGLQAGDEVIVPGMTFAATAEAVIYCGATPVFVDARSDDLLIDPDAVRAAITPRTRGVIPVHLYGAAADMDALGEIARAHGLWLLEDAAQAQGTVWGSQKVGSFGVAGCFSFYPSKNLGAYGDAGMIVTSDRQLADRVRMMRHHGQRRMYQHETLGWCSRLDSLQAAVLAAKLPFLDGWNRARRDAALRYDALIGDHVERVGLARRHDSIQYVYVVRIAEGRRDGVAEQLKADGIGVGMHYPVSLNAIPAFVQRGLGGVALPVAEAAAAEVLSLPLYPEITLEQQERVTRALVAAL